MTDALLDTGILIRYLRGQVQARDFLDDLGQSTGLFLSAMTVLELLIGCRNRADELQQVEALVEQFTVVAMDHAVCRNAARLIHGYPDIFGSELSRGTPDAIIAACAWERGAALYTLNTRHFLKRPIDEIEVIALNQNATRWNTP